MSPAHIRYANENAKIMLESIDKFFDVFETKFVTLSSATDSIIPATKDNPSLHKTIFKTGDMIVKNITINPEYPMAFFMRILLAMIKLKPSER